MPRAGPDPAVIAADAAELADEIGWDQLTLAAVAARFGVRQPSLYKHVAGLRELRRDVSVLAGRELHSGTHRRGRRQVGGRCLQAMARPTARSPRSIPGGTRPASSRRHPATPSTNRWPPAILRTVSAVLAGFGMTGDDTIHAIRGLRALMHGFVSLEAAGGFAMPQDLDESYRRLIDGFAWSLRRGHPAALAEPLPPRGGN